MKRYPVVLSKKNYWKINIAKIIQSVDLSFYNVAIAEKAETSVEEDQRAAGPTKTEARISSSTN